MFGKIALAIMLLIGLGASSYYLSGTTAPDLCKTAYDTLSDAQIEMAQVEQVRHCSSTPASKQHPTCATVQAKVSAAETSVAKLEERAECTANYASTKR